MASTLPDWVIPSEADSEFVACMEEVLATYERPFEAGHPVVCMDEQPVQLMKEMPASLQATPEEPRHADYEYESRDMATVLLFCEPLMGWLAVIARPRCTEADWTLEVARLLEGRYSDCDRVALVLSHPEAYTKGAFYTTFAPPRARDMVRRIDFHYTPDHGGWLNFAKSELAAMKRQFLSGRRIGDLLSLRAMIAAWPAEISSGQRRVAWRMKIDGARRDLNSA